VPENLGGDVVVLRAWRDVVTEAPQPTRTALRHRCLGDPFRLDRGRKSRKLDSEYGRLKAARHRTRTQWKRPSCLAAPRGRRVPPATRPRERRRVPIALLERVAGLAEHRRATRCGVPGVTIAVLRLAP